MTEHKHAEVLGATRKDVDGHIRPSNHRSSKGEEMKLTDDAKPTTKAVRRKPTTLSKEIIMRIWRDVPSEDGKILKFARAARITRGIEMIPETTFWAVFPWIALDGRPKQAYGEMVAAMVDMPEWEIVETAIRARGDQHEQ